MAESNRKKITKYVSGTDTEAALRRKGSTVAQRKAGRIEASVRTGDDRHKSRSSDTRGRSRENDDYYDDFDDRFEDCGLGFGDRPVRERRNETGQRAARKSANGRVTAAGKTGRTGTAAAGNNRRTTSAGNGRASAGRPAARTTAQKTPVRRPARAVETYDENKRERSETTDDIIIISVLLLCILMVLSYFHVCGSLGNIINMVVFGLFGRLGYALPFIIFIMTCFFVANKDKNFGILKYIFAFLFLCITAGLIQMISGGYDETLKLADHFTNSLPDAEASVVTYGGILGGFFVYLLCPLLGNAGTAVTLVALTLILFILITGRAIISYMTRKLNKKAREYHQTRKIERSERRLYEDEYGGEPVPGGRVRRRMGTLDVNVSATMQNAADNGQTAADSIEPEAETEYNKNDRKNFIDRIRHSGTEKTEPVKTSKQADGDEELKSIEPETVMTELPKDSGFTDEAIGEKFGEEQTIDIMKMRNNPNPIRKNTTRQYIVSEEDSNIVKFPSTRSLHSGSSNPEGNGMGYKIHGLYPDNDVPAEETENRTVTDISAAVEENSNVNEEPLMTEEEYMAGGYQNYNGDEAGFTDVDELEREKEREKAAQHDEKIVSFSAGSKLTEPDNAGESETAGAGSPDAGDDIGKKQPERRVIKICKSDSMANATRDSSGSVRFTDISAAPAATEAPKPVEYKFPPISLLKKFNGDKGDIGAKERELEATIKKLQDTFESFGVGVKVTDASVGPTVTRYELLPDQGVKVKTITSLSDDIKLALAAPEIRIEAPIPGKAAVGIEVPNKESSPVLFGDLIDSEEFRKSKSKLSFAVGKGISGETVVSNIGGMPHALIAGATGSGKSVCINALIMSILYKAKPSEVKMIMIDPKRVELVGYNGIPHLLVPVVTDVKKAGGALNWAIAEMDNRYKLFADNMVTNLASYNELMEENYRNGGGTGECPDRLPQILIIVDELNDLMMTANSKDIEAAICRLTQLARACGIHVILATQRPSVNVITGTIKANIPTRIAFSVSSLVDSRTIIDQGGAEKLLGKGDMLFYPQGYAKPVRLQGAYVSDGEVAQVVKFIKEQFKEYKYSDAVSRHIDSNSEGGNAQPEEQNQSSGNGRDEYFYKAGQFIIEKNRASIGVLQRVYQIGFNRAARIMDQLAEAGVVGPEEGTKPRKILMTMQEFDALNGKESDTAPEK